MSRQHNQPEVDIQMLTEEIKSQHPDYKVVALCRMIGDGIGGKLKYAPHIFTQMREMSKSRIIILDTYCIPASILKHRSHQTIVQMWHSIGTMKKNSYSILDQGEGRSSKIAKAMNMHENYDIIYCAGEGYKEYLAESFNYSPDKLTVIPLPIVDRLRDRAYQEAKRKEIIARYPEYAEGKNIVYAPTFRMDDDEKENFDKAVAELKAAVAEYGDKYNLIIKAHPLSDVESNCKEYGTADMLAIADYFISDYSCVIYEAGIMDIPLFFYTYDYDEYMSRRSVYMDYPNEIPGAMHADAKSLLEDIDSGKYDKERLRKFIKKYVELPEGRATEKMVKHIFSVSEGSNGR